MNPVARQSDFQDAVITEAVQLIEQAGPLDDAQAMREAAALHAGGPARIAQRACVLGQRIGLQHELARARAWAPWVLLALVALVVLAGLTLAGSVVGNSERRINVVVALASLLGLHLLTLLLWLLGLLVPLGSFQASFGWIWLALTARVAGGRRGQAPLLLQATTRLMGRARLLPWALGLVSHAVWSLSFAVVVAALLFALAFRSYTLNWETTILEPAFFVRAVQWLGVAPSWLGFPVPDAAAVLSPLATASGQRAWALWLTGCIVVYGLLPRVAFALLCAAVWTARRKALQPDLSQAYFSRLLARFDAMAPRHIVDADPGPTAHGVPKGLSASAVGDASVRIGFELPAELPWPPAGAEAQDGARVFRIDGSADARRALLDDLVRLRPRTAFVACHAASTPDRGTERFLREVMSLCGECRLQLPGADAAARRRWQGWLAGAGLERLLAPADAEALR